MSDLTAFHAHALAMSTAKHKPTCELVTPRRWLPVRPNPDCPGCVTDDERAMWARLAAEVDEYLDPHPTLWETE